MRASQVAVGLGALVLLTSAFLPWLSFRSEDRRGNTTDWEAFVFGRSTASDGPNIASEGSHFQAWTESGFSHIDGIWLSRGAMTLFVLAVAWCSALAVPRLAAVLAPYRPYIIALAIAGGGLLLATFGFLQQRAYTERVMTSIGNSVTPISIKPGLMVAAVGLVSIELGAWLKRGRPAGAATAARGSSLSSLPPSRSREVNKMGPDEMENPPDYPDESFVP